MSLRQLSRSALNSVQERIRVFISTSGVVKAVEQAVGIVEVRGAQENVLKFESAFAKSQIARRNKQQELTVLQSKLKSVQNQLGKLSRTDDRYLDLVTEEHGLLRKETTLRSELELFEHSERTAFSELSTALRYSHERERAYGERTKYFSIVGSVTGALLGAIATGLSGYLRVRELHAAVDASADQCVQLQHVVGRLEKEVSESADKNLKFLDEFRHLVGINSAAILLAGVGEDQPTRGGHHAINPSNALNVNSPELTQIMSLVHTKLDSIESTVNKLSPVEKDGESGGLVVRCEHSQQPTATTEPSTVIVEDIDKRINDHLRTYTITVGSLAVVSGVALALSLIFSFR